MSITPKELYELTKAEGRENDPICVEIYCGEDNCEYVMSNQFDYDFDHHEYFINAKDTYKCVWLNGEDGQIY